MQSVSPLFIVKDGKSDAVIVSSPQAGRYEQKAAEDLAKYIKIMTGAVVPIVTFGVSRLGSTAGQEEFELRNMFVARRHIRSAAHSLWSYARGLVNNPFESPLTNAGTMEQVARNVAPRYLT